MTEQIVLGVDGGGTKTDAIVVDSSGGVLGFGTSGGANWESVGLDGMITSVSAAISEALGSAALRKDQIVATGFALAGMDWPSDHGRVEPSLGSLGFTGPMTLVNDSFAALRAGCSERHGCVSVVGTGGVTAGRNRRGDSFRTMGIGWGEGGGSGTVVEGALHAIAREHHGQGAPTMLTALFLSESGARSTRELFERLSRDYMFIGSDYAPVVLDAARADDPAAIRVTMTAGRRHARDVIGVAARLGMSADAFDLVLAGGIHLSGEQHFAKAFAAEVGAALAGARLTLLDAPPAAGAALLAMDLIGIDANRARLAACAGAVAARERSAEALNINAHEDTDA